MGRSDDLCTPTSESHCDGPAAAPAPGPPSARRSARGNEWNVWNAWELMLANATMMQRMKAKIKYWIAKCLLLGFVLLTLKLCVEALIDDFIASWSLFSVVRMTLVRRPPQTPTLVGAFALIGMRSANAKPSHC
jgi:hypothetical protein